MPQSPLIINGWTLFTHTLFQNQVEKLTGQVQRLKKKDPVEYKKKNATKRLAAIYRLAFEIIPQDPTLPIYRQGGTLGDSRKHWFRAKFFQQYRLFFRYHAKSKIIIYVWVNDEKTRRAFDSKTEAYRVFEKMLTNGSPPEDWNELLQQTKAKTKA